MIDTPGTSRGRIIIIAKLFEKLTADKVDFGIFTVLYLCVIRSNRRGIFAVNFDPVLDGKERCEISAVAGKCGTWPNPTANTVDPLIQDGVLNIFKTF